MNLIDRNIESSAATCLSGKCPREGRMCGVKVETGVPGATMEVVGLAVWMLCVLSHPCDTEILAWQGVDSRD